MIAKAIAEIVHTPAARPSTPSEKFTTFMRKTRPSRVSGSAALPRSTWPMNGSVKSVTTTPESTGINAAITWPTSLAPAGSSKRSSSAPRAVITAAPPRIARVVDVSGSSTTAASTTPAKIAMPPSNGTGRSDRPRSRGSSTRPARSAIRRTTGVRAAEPASATTKAVRALSSSSRAVGGRRWALGRSASRQVLIERVAISDRSCSIRELVPSLVELRCQRCCHDFAHFGEVLLLQAAGRQGRRADAQAARYGGRPRIEGDRVAVDRDPDLGQPVLGLLAVEIGLAQVHQDEVDVGTAGEHVDPVAGAEQGVRHRLGAGDRALLALAEGVGLGDAQRDRLAGDDVLERAALLAGEDGRVDLLGQLVATDDHAAAGAAERLVDGCRHDVGVRDGVRVHARGDQAGEVGHVDEQVGARLVGYRPEGLEIEVARVGRPAGDDHLGPVLERERADLVHVDELVLSAHVVRDDVVELARHVDPHAVREVAAVAELHAEQRVARVHERVVGGGVGLGPGVWLDVYVVAAEDLLGPLDRKALGHVDPLAAAVVATPDVALGVLVGQHRALTLEHGLGHEVLRGDHLERALLAFELVGEDVGDLGIDLGERSVEEVGRKVDGHGVKVLGSAAMGGRLAVLVLMLIAAVPGDAWALAGGATGSGGGGGGGGFSGGGGGGGYYGGSSGCGGKGIWIAAIEIVCGVILFMVLIQMLGRRRQRPGF